MTARKPTEPKRLAADYQKLLTEPWGRRILHDLYQRCFMARTTATSTDAGALLFNEGRRSIFLHVMTTMALDWKDYEAILEDEDEL